jgi:hypothetical protein
MNVVSWTYAGRFHSVSTTSQITATMIARAVSKDLVCRVYVHQDNNEVIRYDNGNVA